MMIERTLKLQQNVGIFLINIYLTVLSNEDKMTSLL